MTQIKSLICISLIFSIIGCSSNSDEIAQSVNEQPSAAIPVATDPRALQVTLSPDELTSTNADFAINLSWDNLNPITELVSTVLLDIDGALWEIDKLPQECTIYNTTGEEILDTTSSIECSVINQILPTPSIAIEFPIYLETDINVTTRLLNASNSIIDQPEIYNFSYYPTGNTMLSEDEPFAKTILDILQLSEGQSFKDILEAFYFVGNCDNDGDIEVVVPPSNFPTFTSSQFRNCQKAEYIVDGTISYFQGRTGRSTTIENATISISSQFPPQFSGNLSYDKFDTDEISFDGTFEVINTDSGRSIFSSYVSNCGNSSLKPILTLPNYDEAEGLKVTLQMSDNILGGQTIDVEVGAFYVDEGSIAILSDSGASIRIKMTGGSYPAVVIQRNIVDTMETWILPWEVKYSFYCPN